MRRGSGVAGASAWRGIVVQLGVMLLVGALLTLAAEALSPRADSPLSVALRTPLPFLPLLLWLAFSLLPEPDAERRRRLLGVAFLSALVAASIGYPLMRDFFTPDEWLPLESVFNRIIGFAMTAGALDTGLKLLTLRLLVFPRALSMRSDAIAFAFASAIGYSFYLNLALIVQLEPLPGIAAILILATLAAQVASALFIGLGLTETAFGDSMPLVLPSYLLAATFASGLILAFTNGVMSGPLGLAGNSDRPFFGLVIAAVGMLAAIVISYGFFSASRRRAREAFRSERAYPPDAADAPTPRQRWSQLFGALCIAVCLGIGVNLRDSSLSQYRVYSNIEAGIAARYPFRWLLDEGEGYVFRARDTARRGFHTVIEVSALPVGRDTTERNLLDRLTLRRAQSLIDYTVLGYDIYILPDETAAVSMAYSFVSRDASPFLVGVSSIVAGLDILSIRRGQAVIVSFRADASIYERELATLRWFMDHLET